MEEDKRGILKEKLCGLFREEKVKKIVIALGIAGIALIFISNFFAGKTGGNNARDSTASAESSGELSEYKRSIENSLRDIISKIDGAGRTEIFLTLDNGSENVYALNRFEDKNGGEDRSEESAKSEYFSLRSSDGGEAGMLLKVMEPEVRGVVVVCEGGGDAVTKERVLEAVTKSLNISSARVCITKLSQQTEE